MWLHKYDLSEAYTEEHLWGNERWIVNNEFYCAKILTVNNGFVSSLHMHEHKYETFIGLSGEITLEIHQEAITEIKLTTGVVYSIPINTLHRFYGNGLFMEVSTPDTGDNIKVIQAKEL